MLDDENDKRIKEAAEHYHPAYDDTAWEKMEQLLDEHLPQKKERRKIFFILPSLLLMAVLVFFIVINNGNRTTSNTAETISSKNNTASSVEKPVLNSKGKTPPSKTESPKNSLSTQDQTRNDHHSIAVITPKAHSISTPIDQNKNITPISTNDPAVKENEKEQQNELKEQPVSNTNENGKNKASSAAELKSDNVNNNDSITVTNENNFQTKKASNTVAKSEKETTAIKKTKKTHGFANNFGVSISAGPDVSGVHANKIGRLTAIFGAGLNFAVSKRMSIRSGFYISKKIYSVAGKDYDLPGVNPSYAYLENVNANCKVYEIPLKIDYNFKKTKNHNWFVSTGLSSYLMKKENYDYFYKTISGEVYNKDWTINNKNKHFFSVLSLSGGYQYFFNKQLSFAAEPYLNIPLKGVGEGKVKLNSGGILFTLKMKPFLKNGK